MVTLPTKGCHGSVCVLRGVPCPKTTTNNPQGPLQLNSSGYPHHQLDIDTVGPFPLPLDLHTTPNASAPLKSEILRGTHDLARQYFKTY